MTESNAVTKDILIQYSDLKEEIKDIRKRVQSLKDNISKIEQEGSVIDSVKGGSGGIQTFKIQGFPYPEYTRKKTALSARAAILEDMEMELLELTNKVEEYIQSIDDARMRRLLTFRFIDELNYIQIANKMSRPSRPCTADSVRMEINRFLESQFVKFGKSVV